MAGMTQDFDFKGKHINKNVIKVTDHRIWAG